MAAIGISEFTFGYAFLHEQTAANWGSLTAAPILPSLQQEQEQGWDAHLPTIATDFYYQFKLTDLLSRANSKYIRTGIYATAYYRMSMHRKDNNRQHQRLREHSIANPHTYYVAPELNSVEDFHSAFLGQRLTGSSRMIPLSACDDINDGDQHHITFRAGDPSWIQHSKPKRHSDSVLGKDIEKFYRGSVDAWRPVNKEFAVTLFERTSDLAEKTLKKERPQVMESALRLLRLNTTRADQKEILIRTSQILSVTLGVTLVLVGRKE